MITMPPSSPPPSTSCRTRRAARRRCCSAVMAELGCSWASFHGRWRARCASSRRRCGADRAPRLFDLLGTGAELDAIVMGIADQACSRGGRCSSTATRSASGCRAGAIAAPLVDQDLKAVGAVTLLCEDGGRAWTSDEAKLPGWCAQLLAMVAQRSSSRSRRRGWRRSATATRRRRSRWRRASRRW